MVGSGNAPMVCASYILVVRLYIDLTLGENCQYRHALPPGFVLKSERKAKEEAEKANTISLEEFLETEVNFERILMNTI